MMLPIDGIGVVIPARNEQELLPLALTAITSAASWVAGHGDHAPWVRVIVVLDSCSDNSAAIASNWPRVETLIVDYRSVGAARRHGIDHLVQSSAMDHSRVWIATTDADSQVPYNWLSTQWELARNGAGLMIGTVRPDFTDLDAGQRQRWIATHPAGPITGHIHGANLGFRADHYAAVGGFQGVDEHEDVLLVQSLTEAGVSTVATDSCCVLTSGRQVGRTPGGYAAHLRERL